MKLSGEQLEQIDKRKWHHRIDFGDGVITNSTSNCSNKVDRMAIPFNLEDCSVIDIGTRDGGLAFEFEKRGAKLVISNDIVKIDHFNFEFSRSCLQSNIKYLHCDLYRLPFLKIPKFDVVNCSGVIYHVSDPYLLLMAMRQICKPDGILIIESAVADKGLYVNKDDKYIDPNSLTENPMDIVDGLIQYTPKGSPNSWIPSVEALSSLCRDAGLDLIHSEKWGRRAMLTTRVKNSLRFDSFYLSEPIKSLLQTIEPDYL